MCWCPITALDYADSAYEWLMGQYSSTGTRAEGTWTSLLSDDLSEEFAEYINSLTLEDEDGNILSLTDEDEDGIYITGGYYDYILGQIEYSLNDFIDSYTDSSGSFSYSSSSGGSEGGPDSGITITSADMASVSDEALLEYLLSIDENFDTDDAWITYDSDTDWFSIRSVEDFVLYGSKEASKDVGPLTTSAKLRRKTMFSETAQAELRISIRLWRTCWPQTIRNMRRQTVRLRLPKFRPTLRPIKRIMTAIRLTLS